MGDLPINATTAQGQGVVPSSLLNAFVQTVPNITALRAFVGLAGMQIELQGTAAPGDGGQGAFYWSTTSTAADNGLTVIKPSGAGATGTWIRIGGSLLLGNLLILGTVVVLQGTNVAASVQAVELLGYASVGDLGGGIYYRASVPGAGTGKWQSADGQWWQLSQNTPYDPRQFGAKGDGVTDDHAAFVAAASYGPVLVSPGTYAIAANSALTKFVEMQYGAILKPATGVTITFNGGFNAPINQCFSNATSGLGTIVFAVGTLSVGYPEWWGGLSSNGSVDAGPGAIACNVACPVTQFQQADYYSANTFKFQTQFREIRGYNKHWGAIGNSTRLIVTNGTTDVVQLGPDTNPGGGFNSFYQEIHLRDMSVTRGVIVAGNSSPPTCPAGVRVQFTLYCQISNVWSSESSHGFLFSGNVGTKVNNCYGFRSTSGSVPATDPFSGFFYDGTANIGAAGGNASLYIQDCGASIGGSPTLTFSTGFWGYHGYTDCFISRLETASTQYGEYLDGTSAGPSGTQDFIASNCVYDQCTIAGIYMGNGGNETSTTHVGCYTALAVSGAFVASVQIVSQLGQNTFIGGQQLCGLNTNDIGFSITSSSGIFLTKPIIRQAYRPVVINGLSDFEIDVTVNNPTAGNGSDAVYVTGTNTVGYIRPTVSGGAGIFGHGVNLSGAANSRIEVNTSGIDPYTVNSGAPNKLVSNGTQITSVGAFNTTNYASGVIN